MGDDERLEFHKLAMPISCTIGDEVLSLRPKEFSSGSLGWHGNAKITLHGFRCQANLIFTVVGSKIQGKNEGNSLKPSAGPLACPELIPIEEPPSSVGEAIAMRQERSQKPKRRK